MSKRLIIQSIKSSSKLMVLQNRERELLLKQTNTSRKNCSEPKGRFFQIEIANQKANKTQTHIEHAL